MSTEKRLTIVGDPHAVLSYSSGLNSIDKYIFQALNASGSMYIDAFRLRKILYALYQNAMRLLTSDNAISTLLEYLPEEKSASKLSSSLVRNKLHEPLHSHLLTEEGKASPYSLIGVVTPDMYHIGAFELVTQAVLPISRKDDNDAGPYKALPIGPLILMRPQPQEEELQHYQNLFSMFYQATQHKDDLRGGVKKVYEAVRELKEYMVYSVAYDHKRHLVQADVEEMKIVMDIVGSTWIYALLILAE